MAASKERIASLENLVESLESNKVGPRTTLDQLYTLYPDLQQEIEDERHADAAARKGVRLHPSDDRLMKMVQASDQAATRAGPGAWGRVGRQGGLYQCRSRSSEGRGGF